MALFYLQVDSTTGKTKRLVALWKEDFFTTANNSTVNFVLTNGTLTASNLVEVFQNGILVEEGGGADYTRDVANNKIIYNAAPDKDARIRVRVWG